jgi:hypothetical protein
LKPKTLLLKQPCEQFFRRCKEEAAGADVPLVLPVLPVLPEVEQEVVVVVVQEVVQEVVHNQ